MNPTQNKLFPALIDFIKDINSENISESRMQVLQPLVDYIQQKVAQNLEIRINFICTHNSRRSHLAQVWAQTMACYYHIPTVFCYSGGTEATALFPKVAETLQKAGFFVQTISDHENPIYAIKFADNQHPILGFSKKYDAEFNPKNDFAAVLTCSQADVGCPFIAGAAKRIPITFDDPKAFDATPLQNEKYLERSLQIASELKYVFSKITR
jgi:arsenate reductase